jgi:hypothetical protein
MPEQKPTNIILWSASANAALPSMFKQFLTGLTDADKASIDSLKKAYNDRFKLRVPDAVIARSQDFGRSIANAIYNWSTTETLTCQVQVIHCLYVQVAGCLFHLLPPRLELF